MASWNEVLLAAPELASKVQGRFEATGLALLATIRRDGSPRISGLEPLFAAGELWIGMMPGSRKGTDLRSDRRAALHSATTDKAVTEGDAKVAGLAIPVTEDTEIERFRQAFAEQNANPPPSGQMVLFRLDVTEMSFLKPAGDHLEIGIWAADGAGVRHVDRY